MPTGYTSGIANGMKFDEFLFCCAKAFGALVEMRDEPRDKPIPEVFKPSDYHLNALKGAKADLVKYEGMSDTKADKLAKGTYRTEVEAMNTSIRDNAELKEKYESMLTDVQNWEPPSADHVELKTFMLGQLTESIKFDCNGSYYDKHPPVLLSGAYFKHKHIKMAKSDIDYHKKEYDKEVERVKSNNLWINQLRDSLNKEG